MDICTFAFAMLASASGCLAEQCTTVGEQQFCAPAIVNGCTAGLQYNCVRPDNTTYTLAPGAHNSQVIQDLSAVAFGELAEQLLTTHAGGGVGTPYVGPGDTLTMSHYWGMTAVTQAYAAALGAWGTIERTSDSTTQNINFTPSGNIDVTTAAVFCNATTCKVSALFDEVNPGTAACKMTQTTTGEQPVLVFNFYGTQAAMQFVAANTDFMVTNLTACVGVTQPVSFETVAQATTLPGVRSYFLTGGGASPIYTGMQTSGSTGFLFAGSLTSGGTVTTGTKQAFNYVANGASSVISIDNVNTTVSPGTNALISSQNVWMGGLSNTLNLDGYILEIGIGGAGVAWSAGNLTSMCHNQHVRWGTAVSC